MAILTVLIAYAVGSIDFAVIVSRRAGVDITAEGSGNPGTSNVMRVLGKKAAAVVLVGDAAKGVLAAALGALLVEPTFGYVTLLAAAIGHAYPVWHRFRGGRAVATTIGGILYLAPLVGLVLAIVWIALLLFTKTASIGSLVAMVLLVPALALTGRTGTDLVYAGVLALFVIWRHKDNIARLISSAERTVT